MPHRTPPTATAIATSKIPVAELAPLLADYPLPSMFVRRGIFPGVVAVQGGGKPWRQAGMRRTMRLSDGGQARERLLRFDATGWLNEIEFTDVFRFLIYHVHDGWSFEERGGLTHVRWNWAMNPRPARAWLIKLALERSFGRYMQRQLDRALTEISAAR